MHAEIEEYPGDEASLIAHQTVVYGLDSTARSRLNAVLVSSMFFGMAAGAALASRTLAHWGAFGVAVQGVVAAALALIVRLFRRGRSIASSQRSPSPTAQVSSES